MLLPEICGLVSVGRPLWREDGSAICSAITQWSESLRIRNNILLSHLRLPQPGGPGSRIYIPQEQGGPLMPPGTGFPLRRLLRLAGLRWRYSNPPPTWRTRFPYLYTVQSVYFKKSQTFQKNVSSSTFRSNSKACQKPEKKRLASSVNVYPLLLRLTLRLWSCRQKDAPKFWRTCVQRHGVMFHSPQDTSLKLFRVPFPP
jgi:hypothetical protein